MVGPQEPPMSSLGEPEQAMEGNAGPVRAVPELVAHLVERLVDFEQSEERPGLLQRLIEAGGARNLIVGGDEGTAGFLFPGVQLRLPTRAVIAPLHGAALERGVA